MIVPLSPVTKTLHVCDVFVFVFCKKYACIEETTALVIFVSDSPLRFESLFDCLFVLGLEIFYYDFEKD